MRRNFMIKELITISLLFNGLSFIEKNNFFYFDEIIPNDSKYEEQINAYEKIELSKAWELEKGDSSTLVGIIDSGFSSLVGSMTFSSAGLVTSGSSTG